MSQLVPSVAHGVLTDKEYEQCMRRYVTGSASRTWIAAGDTAPDLVWSNTEEMAFTRRKATSSTKALGACSNPELGDKVLALPPSDTRYRDQFLKLVPAPTSAPTAAAHGAVDRAGEKEHVLISDDEQDDHGRRTLLLSPSASQQQRDVTLLPTKKRATSSSLSPRRGSAGVGNSPPSRASQRQSTGSSVVIVSQPSAKMTGRSPVKASAPKGRPGKLTSSSQGRDDDADARVEVGTKRQRLMEEFLYRGE
ncbi:hypothetical_protein [Leishmania major strain Friedlin]|nr:hypothetical_protein [Leishmania major strain Friedlin]